MAEGKSSRENWGFFELVLKIGFGVAFGFLVYDTLGPMAGIAGSEFVRSTRDFPWWSLFLVYPFIFLLMLCAILVLPFFPLLPIFLISNNINIINIG